MVRLSNLGVLVMTVATLVACTEGSNTGGSSSSSSSSSSGQPDAGMMMAMPDVVDCPVATGSELWQPVAGTFTLPADRGRVLRCRQLGSFSASDVNTHPVLRGLRLTTGTGIHVYGIQYVTEAPVGTPRRTTAVVAVPSDLPPPWPLTVVNHGTTGMAPQCSVTADQENVNYMALPFVTRRHAILAPDYVGLGVDDGLIHPYMVGQSEGRAILDGLRALRRTSHQDIGGVNFEDGAFLIGHSQGGQTSLFAQQLWDSTVGFTLKGTIAWAPGLGSAAGMGPQLGNPNRPTDFLSAYVAMIFVGRAIYQGRTDLSAFLTPAAAQGILPLLETQCLDAVFQQVPQRWPTHADLFQPAFLQGAASCPTTGAACPGWEPYASDVYASRPGDFTSNAPVLVLQGLTDTTVTPESSACLHQRLLDNATPVQTCAYPGQDHGGVVTQSMLDALDWMTAVSSNQALPPCPQNLATVCPE